MTLHTPNNRVDPTADLHVRLTRCAGGLWSAVGHPWRSHAAVSWDGTGKGMSRKEHKEHREAGEDRRQKMLLAKGHRQALGALCSLRSLWRVPFRSRANKSVEATAAPDVRWTHWVVGWWGVCASPLR